SSGASPGPVCYGAGGVEPTITDANVILGRVGASDFLGGEMALDEDAAAAATAEKIAGVLDMNSLETSRAIIEIAIAKMMTQRRGMMKDFLRLGDIYQDYAFSGLLEKNSQKHYFSLSCEEYQKALDIETGQPKVMLRYIHSLLQLGEHKHSQKMLKQLSKIWKTNNDIHFLSASMAFYLNKFGDIKKHLEKIVLEDLDDEKIETVKFWLQKT
ncbi:MAG: hypothetical protein HN685_04095, partial [Waddliaceae bacterium]|nr:hypothetical protein [Waddliaceae bacterium]